MINKSETANNLVGNPQLSAALTPMSEAELKRLLSSVGALEINLSGFVSLLNGAEPTEVVTSTQNLLKILADEINHVLAIKQTQDSRDRLQNWDNEGGRVDYAPVYHLLSKVSGGMRRLTWTDIRRVQS
ncbi:MAG: hypothetical protein K8J31_17810 [Anaerolineae bacterium]|nr:hypothetical protein [Anaerolineae bacterium]